jgi:hypothetical protein
MKLITTNKIPSFDKETKEFYKNEFKKDTGLILLPKKLLTEEEVQAYFSIANKFNISVIGLMEQNNGYSTSNKKGMPVLFSKHSFNKLVQPDYFIHNFRNGTDNALTFKMGLNGNSKKNYICDILLFPANNEISRSDFEKNMKSPNNMCKNGLLMYSPLANGSVNGAVQPFGIYDSNLKQLGEKKGDFMIYNYK